MSKKTLDEFLVVAALCLCVFVLGFALGGKIFETSIQETSIQHRLKNRAIKVNAAQYDHKTGKFQLVNDEMRFVVEGVGYEW